MLFGVVITGAGVCFDAEGSDNAEGAAFTDGMNFGAVTAGGVDFGVVVVTGGVYLGAVALGAGIVVFNGVVGVVTFGCAATGSGDGTTDFGSTWFPPVAGNVALDPSDGTLVPAIFAVAGSCRL